MIATQRTSPEARPGVFARLAAAGLVYLLFFGIYGLANRLIPIDRCYDFTLALDQAIPFQPLWVWPFYLTYGLVALPALLAPTRTALWHVTWAFAALIIMSGLLFVIVPVVVPRPIVVEDSLSAELVRRIYVADRPVCGFPSLHVSSALLAAAAILRFRRRWGVFFLPLAILTTVATLLVKQHVLLDVAGGALLAILVDWAALSGGGGRLLKGARAAWMLAPLLRQGPLDRFTAQRQQTPAGTEYDRYSPPRDHRRTVIVVHGLTVNGERDTRLIRFAQTLTTGNFRVAAIALPGLKSCREDTRDLEALIDLVSVLHEQDKRPVAMVAFSLGAGLALTAVTDPRIRGFVNPLLLFGPYYSAEEMWKSFLDALVDANAALPDEAYVRLVIAHRLREHLALSPDDEQELTRHLETYCEQHTTPSVQAFVDRTLNHPELIGICRKALDPELLAKLSPEGKLSRVPSRVLVVHDQHDPLIPPHHTRRIVAELRQLEAAPLVKALITPIVSHVTVGVLSRPHHLLRLVSFFGELYSDGISTGAGVDAGANARVAR